MEVVVCGGSEFTLGFALAGARTVEPGNIEKTVESLLDDTSIGILVLEEGTFNSLSPDSKERIVSAVQPVSVVLSERGGEEELRSMIIKSIGVDLWKSEE